MRLLLVLTACVLLCLGRQAQGQVRERWFVTSDGVRLHYLESGTYPIKEISYILGYNELSAFTRAFKRWTGSSPGNYLKN